MSIHNLRGIFTHLKLCVASARHNFKWVKMLLSLFGYRILLKSLCVIINSEIYMEKFSHQGIPGCDE